MRKCTLSLAIICLSAASVAAAPITKPKPSARKFADSAPRIGDYAALRLLGKYRVSRPRDGFRFAPREVADLMIPKPRPAADFPRSEFFAGFAYGSLDTKNLVGDRSNAIGWNVGVTGNFTDKFGVVGDASGLYGRRDVFIPRTTGGGFIPVQVNYTAYTLMGGPQATSRGEKVNVFARAMAGVAITDVDGVDDHAAAFGVGGGVDAKLSDRISWRVLQADYILTRFQELDASARLRTQTQHSVKVSSGLVFR